MGQVGSWFLRVRGSVAGNGYKVYLGAVYEVLESDSGNDCTTRNILKTAKLSALKGPFFNGMWMVSQ